jgi:hypothetical protein
MSNFNLQQEDNGQLKLEPYVLKTKTFVEKIEADNVQENRVPDALNLPEAQQLNERVEVSSKNPQEIFVEECVINIEKTLEAAETLPLIKTSAMNVVSLNTSFIGSSPKVFWIDSAGDHQFSNYCKQCAKKIVEVAKSRENSIVIQCSFFHKNGRPKSDQPTPFLYFLNAEGKPFKAPLKIHARRGKPVIRKKSVRSKADSLLQGIIPVKSCELDSLENTLVKAKNFLEKRGLQIKSRDSRI